VVAHRYEISNLLFHSVQLLFEQPFDLAARRAVLIPNLKNLRQFGQRETDCQCVTDEAYAFDGSGRIEAVIPRGARWNWKQLHALVMTQRVWTDPAERG
jgi:hypothetical protein